MTITVDLGTIKNKPRIILRGTPFSQKERCKGISGAAWSPDDKVWHYPLDMTVCILLRQAFPTLEIGPSLWAWARAEKEKHEAISNLHVHSLSEPVSLPILEEETPVLYSRLMDRGFQTIVPKFAAEVGNFFLADQPGLGKTVEILASLIECEVIGNILVVAPRKALRATWVQEIEKWLSLDDLTWMITVADSEEGKMEERDYLIEQAVKEFEDEFDKDELDRHFVLCNPEMMRWEFVCEAGECSGNKRGCPGSATHTKNPLYPALMGIEWDAIIVDETHKFLMNANERSARVSQQGFGFQKLKIVEDGLKIAASGTPFKGKPRKFWPVLHWLRPDKYTGEGKWAKTYFETESDVYAYGGEKLTDRMRSDRQNLFEQDLSMIMVRRTKRELHAINPTWAPPDKQYVSVLLEMDAKQKKAYKAMEKAATVALDSGTLMANGILAEMTRLKQLAIAYGRIDSTGYHPALPSCKWEWLKNSFLAERGILDNDGTSKVVIASQYVEVLKLYSAELTKVGVAHYLVEGPTKNIEEIKDDWQNNPAGPRVMLLSTMAGGVSLTLDAADDLVIDDETWTPDDQEQVEDRVHRTSRTDHQVTIYRLITVGTIDEAIYQSGDALDNIQKAILDGRRGVEFAKKLLAKAA